MFKWYQIVFEIPYKCFNYMYNYNSLCMFFFFLQKLLIGFLSFILFTFLVL